MWKKKIINKTLTLLLLQHKVSFIQFYYYYIPHIIIIIIIIIIFYIIFNNYYWSNIIRSIICFIIIKMDFINNIYYIEKQKYPRLFPSHNAYILMPVALNAHATFIANCRRQFQKRQQIWIGYSNLFDLYDKNRAR